ncbi:MAG: hypothetical protein ABI823_18550, partial [Bryobacteraceae bacterium]
MFTKFVLQTISGLALLSLAAAGVYAQTPSKNVVGTVAAVRPDVHEVDAKSDTGAITIIKIAPETILKSIAPGETSLSKAVDATVDTIHPGDRVLVTMQGDLVRRVIVMQAKSIEQWKEADRAEWKTRGVAGVVKDKKGNELTLRGPNGLTFEVTVKPDASFKRYPAESVKFADAKASSLSELAVGDQIRARGEKSADGLKVTADEVVFGTFVTRAGVIQSIDPATGVILAKDLGGKETLTVHISADSQIKKFGFPGGGGMGMRPAGDGAGPRAGGPGGPGGPGGSRGPGGPGGPGGGPGGPGGGRTFDIAGMIERLPLASKTDLNVGDTIVFSSSVALASQTDKKNNLTAIVLISNAESSSQQMVPGITLGFNQDFDPAAGMFNATNFPGASTTQLNAARATYAV